MTSCIDISKNLFVFIPAFVEGYMKRILSLLLKRNEIDLSSGIEFNINLLTEYNLNPFVV